MPEELSAVSKASLAPAAQSDYDAICAALMQTERGRWFLEERARRNRSADTQLLLSAIQRIEAVVCAERNKHAQQELRSDLLEMAHAITRTRAEVAELRSEMAAQSAHPAGKASLPAPESGDVFAAAERIRDVTWAMRGHGFDPSTCDQLEELAASILSASALRDPTDRRASKLGEVLQYLEHRISGLLQSCADADVPASSPQPDGDAGAAASSEEAEPVNGFSTAFIAAAPAEYGPEAVQPPEASAPAPRGEFPALTAERHEAEHESECPSPSPAVEIAVEERFVPPPVAAPVETEPELESAAPAARDVPPAAPELPADAAEQVAPPDAAAPSPLRPIPAQGDAVGAQTAKNAEIADSAQAASDAEIADAQCAGETNRSGAEPSHGAAAPAHADALLPVLELSDPSRLLLRTPVEAAPAAPREVARALLPEIDIHVAMPRSEAPAASASIPQAPRGDPLAALKAMSEDELVALFS